MDDKLKNILTLVYELYNKFGIKSITMDDVARELGISKKTLYQHVKDKADLVEKAMMQNTLKYRTNIKAIVKKNTNAIVELLEVNAYMNEMMQERNPSLQYDLKKYYPDIHNRLMKDTRQRMYESIRGNLLKGQKEGIYREEMDIEIICKLHLSRMEYKYSSVSFTPEELHSPAVLREIFLYHLHGITNEKGVQLLNEKLKTNNE
ncbi:MAG: TetR/AcrR family transcriptional regulator [Bacteroidota bacterium]|nr:TetR/AcrR family transcriptional regulator [Bacteroidota bacterium]